LIKITVDKDCTIHNFNELPKELQAKIIDDLTVPNPEYVSAKKNGFSTFNTSPTLKFFRYNFSDLIVPKAFFDATNNKYQVIQTTKCKNKDSLSILVKSDKIQLRDYQEKALKSVEKNINGIIEAPAGSGKTIIGMHIIEQKCRRALWITHTNDLLNQGIEAANLCFIKPSIGKINSDCCEFSSSNDIVFATVQSLNEERIEQLNEFIDIVIIDEAHHYMATVFNNVISKLDTWQMFGLTATPERKDGLTTVLDYFIGPKRIKIDRKDLYEAGKLIKPEIKFIFTEFHMSTAGERNEVGGVNAGDDVNYSEITGLLYKDKDRINLIAQNIVDGFNQYGFSLVLSDSIKYSFDVMCEVERLFLKIGKNVSIKLIHGGTSQYKWQRVASKRVADHMFNEGQCEDIKFNKGYHVKIKNYSDEDFSRINCSKKQREEILADSRIGKVDILFATKLAKEGLDLPNLIVGHKISPARGDSTEKCSETGATKTIATGGNVEQEIGRLQRPAPGKTKAVWYDYVDYNVGIFKNQYYSRRRVYERLGLEIPKKLKNKESYNVFNDKKLFGWGD
jgi:superfamily II DNA or RNA helicase